MKMTILICLATMLLAIGVTAQVKPPNVVIMLTDNQSYYELSMHNHKYVKTPRIDALAAEGVDFTSFYAATYCSPSRTSLQTGRYALRAGVNNTIGGVATMHRSEITVADHLKSAGYTTGIFGKWHLGDLYPYHPSDRGYDEVFMHRGGHYRDISNYFDSGYLDAMYEHNGKDYQSKGHFTEVLFRKGMEFIKASKDQPFFAFITTPAVHNYEPHAESRKKMLARGGFDGVSDNLLNLFSGIEFVDENVGQVLDLLDELGLTENTMVIMATDQGMYGRGHPDDVKVNSAQGYDGRHHVFCSVRYPAWQGKSHTSNALAGMVDLMPTILDAAGIPIPKNVDGRSLRPLLSGKPSWEDDRKLILQCPRRRDRKKNMNSSVKTQKWRLVNGSQLFNVENDWLMANNVAGENPDVVAELNAAYDEFWDSLGSPDEVLSRSIITGLGIEENRLDANGWYLGDQPFDRPHIKAKMNGTWPVEVEQDGLYHFELRWFPKDKPTPIGAVKASLTIGAKSVSKNMNEADESVTLDLQLTKGRYNMDTVFTDKGGDTWGAYFVHVRHANPTGVK